MISMRQVAQRMQREVNWTNWPTQRRVMRRVAAQELREVLWSWPWYITAALGLLLAALLMYSSLSFVAESRLLVMLRPFYVPLLALCTLAMLYSMAWAVLAIARPRDQGALRVLFFAPLDPLGLLGGHVLAGVAAYTLLVLGALPLLLLMSWQTNLPFASELLLAALLSPLFVPLALTIGLCISAVASTSRSAMFWLIGVVVALFGLQVLYQVLLRVPPTSTYYDALLSARSLLWLLNDLLGWLSPTALLSGAFDAIARGAWGDALWRVVVSLLGAAVWLRLAVRCLAWRGVLP